MISRRFALSSSSTATTATRSIFTFAAAAIMTTSPRFHSTRTTSTTSSSVELSKLKSLDPPFTPVYKDERSEEAKSSLPPKFKVVCRGCQQRIFDSSVILRGNPSWPTFCAVSSPTNTPLENSNHIQRRDDTMSILRLSHDQLETIVREGHSQLEFHNKLFISDENDGENDGNEEQDNGMTTTKKQQKATTPSSKNLTESEKFDLELQELLDKQEEEQQQEVQKQEHQKPSLILSDTAPTMRWGVTAANRAKPKEHKESLHERLTRRREDTFYDKIEHRAKVRRSKELPQFTRRVRNAPAVCRGFCRNCDTFICLVFSGSAGEREGGNIIPSSASPVTGQKFVCNPSSIILKDLDEY